MPLKAPHEMDIETRLENILAKTGARDRINIEKHLAVCDGEPDQAHGALWRRIFVKLAELAPLPMRTAGPQIVQFFVADGKYRMQVFALEDNRDAQLLVYLPNVLAAAVREKLLVKSGEHYSPAGASKQPLTIEQMDATHPADPPEHVKHLTGWNRKAMKVTLSVDDAESQQVLATEALCALAAKQWPAAAAVVAK